MARPTRPIIAAVAGATASLATLYTYQPLKLIPLLVLVWLLWLRRVNKPAYQRLRSNLPAFAVAFLVVGTPMLAAAAMDPASYFGRAAGVAVGDGSAVDLPQHWLQTLGMFVVTGDPNRRHDVAQLPLLGWPLFALAIIGTVRLWRGRRQPAHAMVLWSLPVFLLPPLIAIEGGAPHFLRALGLAAPLAVTIGLGVSEIIEFASKHRGRLAAGSVGVIAALGLISLAIGSGLAYFSQPMSDRYDAYRYDLATMASEASPNDVVILDDYTATVIRFLDAGRVPTIARPGTRISALPADARVLALSREDLYASLGNEAAEHIAVLARNPRGSPAVWVFQP